MTPAEEHERRIRRIEESIANHEENIQLLRGLMERVVMLNEVVVDLLQRQSNNDEENGR